MGLHLQGQVRNTQAQGIGKRTDRVECWRTQSPLDQRYIVSVQVRFFGQRFLGQSLRLPAASNGLAKCSDTIHQTSTAVLANRRVLRNTQLQSTQYIVGFTYVFWY